MDPAERLPGDQRAVLQLVLGQRRSYSEIARMLSIAPQQVRDRALAALAALGPPTTISENDRGLIGDYLLGQLTEPDADAARDALARSPAQRAWARVVASELRPLASEPIPQLPDGELAPSTAAPTPPPRAPEPSDPATVDGGPSPPRSSRAGGIVVLSLVAAAIIAAIVIFVIKPGGGSHADHDTIARAPAKQTGTAGSASSSSQTTSASQSATIVGQINLAPPTGGGKAKGTAFVLAQGSLKGLGIEAVHVPPNTKKPRTDYAVWLYNSPSDTTRLGFVNPPVPADGKLDASARLPANTTHYKLLIITLQTQTAGHTSSRPGPVVLEGRLSDVARAKL